MACKNVARVLNIEPMSSLPKAFCEPSTNKSNFAFDFGTIDGSLVESSSEEDMRLLCLDRSDNQVEKKKKKKKKRTKKHSNLIPVCSLPFDLIVTVSNDIEPTNEKRPSLKVDSPIASEVFVDLCGKRDACRVMPSSQPGGPILMSHRDPEITDDERRLRKYGKGVNLTVHPIGNGSLKRKSELNKWISVPPGFKTQTSDFYSPGEMRLSSSPFSFGFTI